MAKLKAYYCLVGGNRKKVVLASSKAEAAKKMGSAPEVLALMHDPKVIEQAGADYVLVETAPYKGEFERVEIALD